MPTSGGTPHPTHFKNKLITNTVALVSPSGPGRYDVDIIIISHTSYSLYYRRVIQIFAYKVSL